MDCFLALDQGTTSSRSLVFDRQGRVLATAQQTLKLATPCPGWVEQDALELWYTQIATAHEALERAGVRAENIRAVGLANQRETTVVWERASGKPVAPALVWQDRRCQDWCRRWQESEEAADIQERTGLTLDPYFSAGKLAWLLEHIPGLRERAQKGELAFGTVDSWLLWHLSGGAHLTDVSNASRTLLMNTATAQWDGYLLDLFDIPTAMLPKIVPSGSLIAHTREGLFSAGLPIYAALGDQQAALFGQGCERAGMAKNTYGTGCFMLMNTGNERHLSQNRLISTIAWQRHPEARQYALEGSVFMGGAIVQWLRDNLGIISCSDEVESCAAQVADSGGVVLVPAFTGLGAPYWRPEATAALLGLTRGSHKAHICRAALEAIAFQVADVLAAMNKDVPVPLAALRVDGGVCRNDTLMQFQADILGVPVLRPQVHEVTALGAAKMAALAAAELTEADAAGWWRLEREFTPKFSEDERAAILSKWQQAVARVLD